MHEKPESDFPNRLSRSGSRSLHLPDSIISTISIGSHGAAAANRVDHKPRFLKLLTIEELKSPAKFDWN